MKKKPKIPKDLGVKIGTKREAFLTKVMKGMEEEIETNEQVNDVDRLLIAAIKKEIKKEQMMNMI